MSNCSAVLSLPQALATMSVRFAVQLLLEINDRSLKQALSRDSHVAPD